MRLVKPKNITPDLSIIIPAYREEKRIGDTLDKLASYLITDETMRNVDVEVLVVAADTTDRTHEVVESKKGKFKNFSLLKPGAKVGKGRDVQYGMLRAKGKAVIFMDADLATPMKYLKVFYKAFIKGSDVVIATRNLHNHHPNHFRRSLSKAGNLLFRVASGIWVEDSQCGFKLFSNYASQLCFSKLTIMGWGFDMEVLAIAKANNLKLKTIRINDWKDVPNGTFELNILSNFFYSFVDLMKICLKRIRNDYLE